MSTGISSSDFVGQWSLSFADIDFINSKPTTTMLGLAASKLDGQEQTQVFQHLPSQGAVCHCLFCKQVAGMQPCLTGEVWG